MIAKHIPMKNAAKSDFSNLVAYLTDKQSKEHRVGQVMVTNCQSDNVNAAVPEVLATQAMNTRASNDKTYHLIVSFRPGEQIEPNKLKAIEEMVCKDLGFSEHQRISVVHDDTDNQHIHIAINKIHPTKLTIHEPFNAYYKLSETCKKAEIQFSLEIDNHIKTRSTSENKVADMERHSGLVTLASFIKENCTNAITQSETWQQLHDSLAEHSISIKPQGNGLVFQSHDGVSVKASTVDRSFSKNGLEKKLGPFSENNNPSTSQAKKASYTKSPKKLKVDTSKLYEQYKKYRSDSYQRKAEQQKHLVLERNKRINEAKANAKMKRSLIKNVMPKGRLTKKILYAQVSDQLKKELKSISKDINQKRSKVNTSTKALIWTDWLQMQAKKGNEEALSALSSRGKKLSGDGIIGAPNGVVNPSSENLKLELDTITKTGKKIFRLGKSFIRDDGERLQLSIGADKEAMAVALTKASKKFGERLSINGTAEFKEQVAQVAALKNIKVTFSDPELEQRKLNIQGAINEQRERNRTNERGRSSSISTGDTGRTRSNGRSIGGRFISGVKRVVGKFTNAPGTSSRDTGAGRSSGGSRPSIKPDFSGSRQEPPTRSINMLRRLSRISVVRFTGGSEVLLSSHAPNNVEQPRAEPANSLRRNLFGSGVTEKHIEAAQKYIAERAEKINKGFAIEIHKLYNKEQENLKLAGVRRVDGLPMALLEATDKTIHVLPLSEDAAKKAKTIKRGSIVKIANGELSNMDQKRRSKSR